MALAARRRRWTVIAMLLLVAAVAAVAAVAVRDGSGHASTSLIPGDPRRLTIARPDRAYTVLERDGPDGDWRITSPCALQVEPRRLSPLFDALAGGGARYPRDQVDGLGAGLQPPLATLSFDGTALSIGGTDLSGERRYVATDERVELVPEWIWPLVNGGLSALAVPDVFTRTLISIEGTGDGLDADVSHWNALQASQTIAWPPAGPAHAQAHAQAPAEAARRVTFGFEDGGHAVRDIVLGERFEAVVHEDGGCAHLLAPGTLRTAPPPPPPAAPPTSD